MLYNAFMNNRYMLFMSPLEISGKHQKYVTRRGKMHDDHDLSHN